MAVRGATQALIAAFTFGVVVNAASAALFLFTRGHGSSIFRDGLRLVLITFLLTSALWAQIDFITTVIDITKSTTPCQIGLAFSTLFDQLGRFAAEQYLLWAMVTPGKTSVGQTMAQVLIAARFVVGAVFVGFTRPQVDTFCVARSSVAPVAFTVIALDGVIIVALAARAFMTGLVADVQQGKPSSSRSKSILLVMVGFVIWTATSVTMMLGLTSVDLIFRTAVPAIGLSILIIIVTACSGELTSPRESPSRPPEAPSPRRINISRDISTADSSDYPPSRYEDLKEQAIRSSTAFLQPREAPRAAEDNRRLPTIARPITGIVGVGGVPVQGALFPPMRSETAPTSDGVRRPGIAELKQKRSLFNLGGGSAASGGKITIGNPILLDNDAQNPLKKIATIDLKEAARAEQDRRALALERGPDVALRPAPQPPNMTPEEALKRSVSVRRKEVGSVLSPPAVPAANLQPGGMSSTTSAQLSPGVEEIRRRSPRQLPADYRDAPLPQPPATPPQPQEPRVAPVPVEEAPEPQPIVSSPVQMRPVTPPPVEKPASSSPRQPVARPSIRPSRKLSSPKKEAPPVASKTPLQRRPTTGLPPGPRARKLDVAKEAGAQAQQTVLFVNNIVYDDPSEVQRIIDGASDRASKMAPQPHTPDDANSVVHRPRPIPRKPEPGSEEARRHRRSRSGGSLVSRKSILTLTPGSPTQLPPLPPPPKSAGISSRPQPNDTKSMTVDEKMGLFFPAPPSGGSVARRKSVVPGLPPVPREFIESSSAPTEPADHRRSNRTTKTSIQTDSLFDVDEIPAKPVNKSRFSPETNLADDVDQSWLPGIVDDSYRQTRGTEASSEGGAGKRGSSPVLPLRTSAWTETSDSRTRDTRDDSTSRWDSVYSPEIAVGIQVTPQVARATSIQRGGSRIIPDTQPQGAADERGSGVVVDFVLDTGFEVDDDGMLRPGRASQWHRRVGDDCPSFSERKEKTRSRKMPPPTPLLLNAGAAKGAVVVRAAEPSPIESPEHALQEIQAQLRKLEQPSRDSVESGDRRLALLENLEREMGMQEDQWHEMQHDLGRNSMSSVGTASPRRNSRRESVVARQAPPPPPPPKTTIAQERRALRRSWMRTGSTSKATAEPSNARADAWQQKLALAEAEMEYMDGKPGVSKQRGFNFLTVSKAQLGSPTPPDSDQSDQSDEEASMAAVAAQITRGQPQRAKSLWAPATPTEHRSGNLLWSRPAIKPTEAETALPGLSVRPAQRKVSAPLAIESRQLWSKPYNKTRETIGLWRPMWARPQQTRLSRPASTQPAPPQPQRAPRPLTQRPARRTRRVTLLPDIVEDPQPLPDKRGTLGIFQFPWGERSDTASVAPTMRPTMVMAMPGTMTSGGQTVSAALQARARELEAAEYSSSFFDEYDDEVNGSGDDSDEGEDDDEDDDFDETTLWEIASLLKTDGLPSKASLFPPPLATSVVDDYMNDIPSDDEAALSDGEETVVIGLEDQRDRESVPVQKPTARSREVEVSVIESDSLWTPEAKKADPAPPVAPAGSKPTKIPGPSEVKNARRNRKYHALGLWNRTEAKTEASASDGLFKVDPDRSDYRTTSQEPVAKNMARKPRPAEHKPLPRLESSKLWTKTQIHHRAARFHTLSHGLWALPQAHQPIERHNLLFAVDPSRTDYRTTSQEPIAINMARKPRPVADKPLARLDSSSLWTKPHGHHRAARFHALSHGLWAPARRARQPTSERHGLFALDRSRTDYRTTSAPPAAHATTRKPRRPQPGPLDRLTSTRLWSGPASSRRREPNWLAVRPRRRRPSAPATEADWAAALAAAVKTSYPRAKPHRAAAEADWAAALAEALGEEAAAPPAFDPALCHPVFATRNLAAVAEAEAVHPAAAGGALDVAVVHPAFLGGGMGMRHDVRGKGAEAVHPDGEELVEEAVVAQQDEAAADDDDALAAQIRALEEEKMFVARAAEELYRQRVLPAEEEEWEQTEARVEIGSQEEVTGADQRDEELLVRREVPSPPREMGRRELRRTQILAQIKAIEEGAELDTFVGRAGGRERDMEDDEGPGVRSSGVVLRY